MAEAPSPLNVQQWFVQLNHIPYCIEGYAFLDLSRGNAAPAVQSISSREMPFSDI